MSETFRAQALRPYRDSGNKNGFGISTEAIKQDLDSLTPNQLQQVADFIAFLKLCNQRRHRVVIDPMQLADLLTEFADEDRAFAEAGMSDYAVILHRED